MSRGKSDQQPIKAERATLKLSETLTLECFRMPNGEKRIGQNSTMKLLKLQTRYFTSLVSGKSKSLEGLQAEGFLGCIVPISFHDGKQYRESDTISVEDFKAIVNYEANQKKNPVAIGLLSAAFDQVLTSELATAYNEQQLTQAEKYKAFDQAFNLAYEQASVDNREDVQNQWLPGDAMAYPQFGYGFNTLVNDSN